MSNMADLYLAAPSAVALTEGYSLEADSRGYYGNIRFWFSGADLFGFTSTVTGKKQSVTINGVAQDRRIPLVHPYITNGNCYCDSVHVYPPEGAIAGWDGTAITFADYFADVHFATPTYQMEGGDMPTVLISLDNGVDRVTRPGSSYLFPSDNTRLNHDVGVSVHTIDFTVTNHKLDKLSEDLYDGLIGCVNLTPFRNKPTGTVLYEGPRCQQQYVVGGSPMFDAGHSFKYRSIPHNQVMRPDGSNFEAPIESGGQAPTLANQENLTDPVYLYPVGELNQLWGK